jgi:hypothetical protein
MFGGIAPGSYLSADAGRNRESRFRCTRSTSRSDKWRSEKSEAGRRRCTTNDPVGLDQRGDHDCASRLSLTIAAVAAWTNTDALASRYCTAPEAQPPPRITLISFHQITSCHGFVFIFASFSASHKYLSVVPRSKRMERRACVPKHCVTCPC